MNAPDDDDALILALVSVERSAAVDALYRRYAPRFAGYLRRRGWPPADIEDAVQEAFIRLIRRAETFRPEGQGRAWIWTVARSAWADLARKAPPPTAGLDEQAERALGVVPDVAHSASYQDCVHGQLERYATAYPEAGQAIVWAAVDGLRSSQIAELLGRTPGATREFLSQARKRLREFLEPCLD